MPQESQICVVSKNALADQHNPSLPYKYSVTPPPHPGTSKVGSKIGVSIGNISSGDREVFNQVVAHHGIEIYLIWPYNISLGFLRYFPWRNLFPGESLKVLAGIPHKCHILGLLGINVWDANFIILELDFSIVGMQSIVSIASVISDMISYIIYIYNAEDVGNLFLFKPVLYVY